MNTIILVAETGSDITPALAAQYNIQIVPMHVAFGTETRDDGTFPSDEIRDYYQRTGKLPTTSGSTSTPGILTPRSCIWPIPPSPPALTKAP